MSKVIYLCNWFKNTIIPLTHFPLTNISIEDIQKFLHKVDYCNIPENVFTAKCFKIVSDDIFNMIENVVMHIEDDNGYLYNNNRELYIYIDSISIPNDFYTTLSKADKKSICRYIARCINRNNFDFKTAIDYALTKYHK